MATLEEWQGNTIVAAAQNAYRAHEIAGEMAQIAEAEKVRPFYLLKPRVFPDGDQWCCLYGENLQEGVAGFGDTPEAAALDFDRNWKGLP